MTLDLPAIRARAEAALPMDLYEAGKALGMAHMDRAALLAEVERLREVLVKVVAHTGHLPSADRELLAGLLASVDRIARAALESPRG